MRFKLFYLILVQTLFGLCRTSNIDSFPKPTIAPELVSAVRKVAEIYQPACVSENAPITTTSIAIGGQIPSNCQRMYGAENPVLCCPSEYSLFNGASSQYCFYNDENVSNFDDFNGGSSEDTISCESPNPFTSLFAVQSNKSQTIILPINGCLTLITNSTNSIISNSFNFDSEPTLSNQLNIINQNTIQIITVNLGQSNNNFYETTLLFGGSTTSFSVTNLITPPFCSSTSTSISTSSGNSNQQNNNNSDNNSSNQPNDIGKLYIPFTLTLMILTSILSGLCIIL